MGPGLVAVACGAGFTITTSEYVTVAPQLSVPAQTKLDAPPQAPRLVWGANVKVAVRSQSPGSPLVTVMVDPAKGNVP